MQIIQPPPVHSGMVQPSSYTYIMSFAGLGLSLAVFGQFLAHETMNMAGAPAGHLHSIRSTLGCMTSPSLLRKASAATIGQYDGSTESPCCANHSSGTS